MFIGRERELQALTALYEKKRTALATVYGRSGMGKTTFLQHFLAGKRSLHFTALEATEVLNLRAFYRSVCKYFGRAEQTPFASWEEAFGFILHEAQSEQFVLVLDEFYYLAHTQACSALAALLRRQEGHLLVLISSSQFSFMESELAGAKNPLAGLVELSLPLRALPYYQAAQFLPGFSAEDKLLLYACLGGAPQYLALVDNSLSVAENLQRLYLSPSGFLYNATMLLLKQELRELTLYNSILTTVAHGCTRMNEIAAQLAVAPNTLNCYLRTLCSLHLLERVCPWGEDARRSKKTQYILSDEHYLFWYHFVFCLQGDIALGKTEAVLCEVVKGLSAYMQQHPFRAICEQYLLRANAQGLLPFNAASYGTWWGTLPRTKEQQSVDLVLASEAEDSILLAACYWQAAPSVSDVQAFLAKRELFKQFAHCYSVIFTREPASAKLQALAKQMPQLRFVSVEELFQAEELFS